MPRSADGEFELVLGNKQLLSLFFLVAVLFAVFFSLGYMVGKSVAPLPVQATVAAPAKTDADAGSLPSPLPPAVEPAARPAEPGGGDEGSAAPKVIETQPAVAPPAVAAAARDAEASARSIAPAQTRQAGPPPAAPIQITPRPDNPARAAQEIHLQIAAVRVRADAEALVESLRKKGYRVMLNDQAGDGWYRVLAGPFSNEKAARDMQADLEKDGFKSILRKP